jgi:Gpi18-like mannosyltransferase
MKQLLRKIKNNWIFLTVVLVSLIVRFYFLDKYLDVSGDLLLAADWGEKYWEYGSKNYYFVQNWYYAPPNYPPLINLYYAYAYKAFDYKYLFAQLHNVIKIPPAAFIIYYYKWGYLINLKLLGIACDVLGGILIYKLVLKLFKNKTSAIVSSSLYLLNPITIVLSSVWGQVDSVVALLGTASILLLLNKRYWWSPFIFAAGLLLKPNWILFAPLYVFIYLLGRPKWKNVITSLVSVIILLVILAFPFSDNPISFYIWFIKERIMTTIAACPHASVSAFNFYTTFLKIDCDLATYQVLGLPIKLFGQAIFSLIYLSGLYYLWKKKAKDENVLKVITLIGFGFFVFMPGMLERYFFPILIPLAVLTAGSKKTLLLYLSLTITFTVNVVWALFRRKYGVIDDFVTGNNFFLLKTISIYNMAGFVLMIWLLFKDNLLKLDLWKK